SRYFFVQAADGIRGRNVTAVQTCALPIFIFSSFRHIIAFTSNFSSGACRLRFFYFLFSFLFSLPQIVTRPDLLSPIFFASSSKSSATSLDKVTITLFFSSLDIYISPTKFLKTTV